MNKEEIWKLKHLEIFSEEEREQIEKRKIEESKKCLNETIQNTYAEGKAIKLENLKHYIEQLEFENTALKAEHNHNITRIKELEQKETILDKVTNYLKTYIDDKQNEYEAIFEDYICQTDKDEYIKENKLAIIKGQKQVLKNVLNIIEKKCDKSS